MTILPPLRETVRAVATFEAERFDVGAERLGDPQAVEGEKRDQGVVPGRRETGGDQQRAEFVAVKAGGVRLVVEPRPTDVDGRGVIDEPFFLGVTEETCDGAESSGHCGPGLALRFEITGEALDVHPAYRE